MATQKDISRNQYLVAIIGLVLLLAYPLAWAVNYFDTRTIGCVSLGDIGSCNPFNSLVFIVGLYFSVLFVTSLMHFGFGQTKKPYYFIMVSLFLAFGLLDRSTLFLDLSLVGIGVVLGVAVRRVRSTSSSRS